MRKRSRKRKAKPRSEYSIRIERLRGTLKQHEFAAKIPVSPSRISEWESGKRPPVAEGFYRLGSLADSPDDAIWFWKQAGLDDKKLLIAARKIAGERAKEGEPLFEKREVILVPRFRETAQGREEAGPAIPLPAEFIPNPSSTICSLVDDKATGVVDSPGALFILDESEKHAPNLLPFWGQVVFAEYDPELGTDPARVDRGIYIGRLVFLVFRPSVTQSRIPGLSAMARLYLLTDLMAQRSPWLGRWTCLSLNGVDDAIMSGPNPLQNPVVIAAQKEARDRGLSELRLDPGWRILGRVRGRLKLEGVENG